ncbi:CLUMA_CG018646, isoform A [Clunio marinus]|uniref:CLUMA_CG018646, isoform A n=1 Tax=Clunio marinus TaxID=568069 RepID=A0A1J1IXV5_9DIPT|nr:CLUMA_CG018646, isoform A [Clunio marinus]
MFREKHERKARTMKCDSSDDRKSTINDQQHQIMLQIKLKHQQETKHNEKISSDEFFSPFLF